MPRESRPGLAPAKSGSSAPPPPQPAPAPAAASPQKEEEEEEELACSGILASFSNLYRRAL